MTGGDTGRWTNQRVENVIGNILRIGVGLAVTLILIGGIFFLARHGSERIDYRVFSGEPADLRGVEGIARDAVSLSGRGIVQLGLLALIGTPIARVAFSVLGFVMQRDWLFAAFTLLVLAILGYSLHFA